MKIEKSSFIRKFFHILNKGLERFVWKLSEIGIHTVYSIKKSFAGEGRATKALEDRASGLYVFVRFLRF